MMKEGGLGTMERYKKVGGWCDLMVIINSQFFYEENFKRLISKFMALFPGKF